MNTRLQVEHPVTECITGVDLVELMIRVAAGEKLPFAQADVNCNGWAIECRINAEDPQRNFLPSTGRLVRYLPPSATLEAGAPMAKEGAGKSGFLGGVRVDTGVYEGGEIPMYYDSMIAKLIVHGRDRNDAIARMREALNAFVIRGISSNIAFQSALLAHPKFVEGDFNTGFIAEQFGKGFRAADVPHDDPMFLVAMAAFVRRKARERSAGISGQLAGHGVKHSPNLVVVVLGAEGAQQHHPVRVDDFDPRSGKADVVIEIPAPQARQAEPAPQGGVPVLGRPGDRRHFAIQSDTKLGEVLVHGTCNGKPFVAQIERGGAKNPLGIRVAHNGQQIETLVMLPRAAEMLKLMPHKAPPDLSKFLLSPMPGLLVDVAVQAGQKVNAGEKLAVIEAMKMENILVAAQDGEVKEILAKRGDSLAVDQPIIAFA
jgi:propionyl-CoA carboxylase alpha chain